MISFERRCLAKEEIPDWISSDKVLKRLVVQSDGCIEVDGHGMLQVDFANKFIGGGVLDSGCVQEEIRFMTNPELILSRLFTEKLLNNEVLFITGIEQFNNYSGYADSFRFNGNFVDKTISDEWGRKYTRIVAMDATFFTQSTRKTQYSKKCIDRELNKAYCGFMERDEIEAKNKSAIASGNWGCGAYNGDPKFKACLQIMAASQCDRELLYFTFHNQELKDELEKFFDHLVLNEINVGRLYEKMISFGKYIESLDSETDVDFFSYMYKNYLI